MPNLLSRHARYRKFLPEAYLALLLLLMWLPTNGLDTRLNTFVLGIRADHIVHASIFLPCACAWGLLFVKRGRDARPGWWWGLSVATAMLTEGVQYLLPYRAFDINDLVANFLGVTVGWMILLFFHIDCEKFKDFL